MNSTPKVGIASVEEVRKVLSARLTEHVSEIEAETYRRISSIARAAPLTDPEYVAGVREALREAIGYAIAKIETGWQPSESVPTAVAGQARRAARSGVPLETVLRRYHAGDRLISQWITDAFQDLPFEALQEINRIQSKIVDHLTAGVVEEYNVELERLCRSPSQRLCERVRRLLDGECDKDASVPYDLTGWHVGLIGSGADIEKSIREAAHLADRQVLCVQAISEDQVWAWFGGRTKPSATDLEQALRTTVPVGATLCIGEIRRGVKGWRLTHAEAQMALQVALHTTSTITRSRDALLLSAIIRDARLIESILETFIQPLEGRGGRGHVLRKTLRTYFEADQNAATTAHRLKVDRSTVWRRLATVETLLGLKITSYGPQIQTALAVEQVLSASPELEIDS